MASFEQHCDDCERLLGDRHEAVNRWLDDGFAKYGGNHRFLKHHRRGVVQAGLHFGADARKAALVHVLRDCGRVPLPRDYEPKESQSLLITPHDGLMGVWPSDEHFDSAARRMLLEEV
jgi:hypothetical protein